MSIRIGGSFFQAGLKYLTKPTNEKVLNFLTNNIVRRGEPEVIRTDASTRFRIRNFKELCNKRLIQHIDGPIRDHRGNGKIELLIRTSNQRLRAKNKKCLVDIILDIPRYYLH